MVGLICEMLSDMDERLYSILYSSHETPSFLQRSGTLLRRFGRRRLSLKKAESSTTWSVVTRIQARHTDNQYIANARDIESELKTNLGKLPLDNKLIALDTIKNKRGPKETQENVAL
ncbi:hypothetical protein ANN_14083 [Periplaneta americana]|uniref:Uncharacterized protein n=1 Tax=Periplaneta americana TaxID=6978 RepID=A0ABQ8SVB4_PERAM|nr:hypothetical protein ANN_14083 [Periplaneta americana]